MHTVWNAIKDLTLTLKEMNYRNHQMLKLHMQFNQERLDFMKNIITGRLTALTARNPAHRHSVKNLRLIINCLSRS